MRIAGVNSSQDPAGVRIRSRCETLIDELRPSDDWSFHEVDCRLIHAERVDRGLDADLVVFLSRHTSIKPVPQLTVHATGNVGEAALGGEPDRVAPCPPAFMQAVLRRLAALAPDGYRVSYERTHHGPTDLETPSCFVEIGSGPDQWTDPAAGEAAARAVLTAVPDPLAVPLLGLGGTQYAARQTAVALSTRGAFGHIIRTADLPRLGGPMLAHLVAASGAAALFVDRKAVPRSELERITDLFEDAGLPLLGKTSLAGLDLLPWDDYTALLALGAEVAPGAALRPGSLAACPDPVAIRLDPALVAEAARTDEPALVESVAALPAVGLTEDGRLLPIFLAPASLAEQIIHDLITLCVKSITGNQQTAIVGDRLIIRRERFDPKKASALGVPPGPLFGRLQRGETVVIDGLEIRPEMVRSPCATEVFVEGLEKYL
ncbi:MAG: D-aminoacyl-tRNA deacylase [Methanospirillum sp.]